MNLYFTLWAQAKQEYMVWEPCKPRLRVHMGVIHRDHIPWKLQAVFGRNSINNDGSIMEKGTNSTNFK